MRAWICSALISTRSEDISSTIPVRRPLYLGQTKKLHAPESFWLTAVKAAESKQARDICVLDLREVTSFADHFILASGANTRQIQAITDEIHAQLKKLGEY